MEKFYSSLGSIPINLLGKNKKIVTIDNNEYQNLFLDIKNEIFNNLLNDKISNDLKIQIFSICNYISLDLYKVFKSALEVNICEQKNIKIYNDKNTVPIFNSIFKNEELKQTNTLKKRSKIFESAKFIKNRLDLFLRGNKKYDLHNQSILLQEYIKKDSINYVMLRPECWVCEKKSIDFDSEIIIEIVQVIIKNLSIRYGIEKKRVNLIIKIFNFLFIQRFLTINHIFKAFQKIDFESLTGLYLLGGTPQPMGRILNYFYKLNKKKVIRFTHGGDRVFFDDILWIYNEIMFCDQYYVHGTEEQISLQKKIKLNPHNKELFKTKVLTIGSEKHKKIFELFRNKNKNNKKKVLFVPGCFLGEAFMHNPFFKPMDIIIADYIFWIIKTINKLGYEISIKAHPGGVQFQNIFKSLPCEVIYKGFDLASYDHTIFMFDFAGTAFFDSLASNKGIIYLNNRVRPFFDSNYNNLCQRCQIIDGFYDDNNNIRFYVEDLKTSMKNAFDQQICEDGFAKKYFFGSKS